MEISFSEIQAYQRCPRKMYYSRVMDLQPNKVALPLAQGIMVHRLLQGFYQDGTDGLTLAMDDQVTEFHDNPFILDDDLVTFQDLMGDAAALTNAYIEHYDGDPNWEILHIEEQFSVEVGGHTITFTPDLVVRDASGQVWIVDHKTTAFLPEPGIPFGEVQAMIYTIALREMYPEITGFIFNHIRKKKPTIPRITKTAPYRVADLARIDTTYEVLNSWLTEYHPHLLHDDSHKRRLAELRGNNKFFSREYVLTTPAMEATLAVELEVWVGRIERDHVYPRVFGNKLYGIYECKKCPMQAICQGELMNWDTERIILERYEPRDLSHKDYEVANDNG